MCETTELKWHGRNKLVDTHQEERIINGVKVMVTVCRPAEAKGSDYPLNWDSMIALEVEEANLYEDGYVLVKNGPCLCGGERQCLVCEKVFETSRLSNPKIKHPVNGYEVLHICKECEVNEGWEW